jgi:hypothetical protein
MSSYQTNSFQPKPTGVANRSELGLFMNFNTKVFSGLGASNRNAGDVFQVNTFGVKDSSDVVRYRKQVAILKDNRTNFRKV